MSKSDTTKTMAELDALVEGILREEIELAKPSEGSDDLAVLGFEVPSIARRIVDALMAARK